jgi:hypothetical protein
MEPEGIVKAWTISVRMTRARRIAMAIASAYSRTTDLRLRTTPTGGAATSSGLRTSPSRTSIRS